MAKLKEDLFSKEMSNCRKTPKINPNSKRIVNKILNTSNNNNISNNNNNNYNNKKHSNLSCHSQFSNNSTYSNLNKSNYIL